MAGEKVMEALDLADDEREAWAEYEEAKGKPGNENVPPPEKNALLKAMGDVGPEQNVLNVLAKIPNASLQDALVVLPFRYVGSMFECLSFWAKKVSFPSLLIPLALKVLDPGWVERDVVN